MLMDKRIQQKNRWLDFLKSLCFLFPSLLGVGVFFILPFGVVIYYSMIDGPITKNFVLFENFTRLFQNSACAFSEGSVPSAVSQTKCCCFPGRGMGSFRISSTSARQ